jgi:hypothetical protein
MGNVVIIEALFFFAQDLSSCRALLMNFPGHLGVGKRMVEIKMNQFFSFSNHGNQTEISFLSSRWHYGMSLDQNILWKKIKKRKEGEVVTFYDVDSPLSSKIKAGLKVFHPCLIEKKEIISDGITTTLIFDEGKLIKKFIRNENSIFLGRQWFNYKKKDINIIFSDDGFELKKLKYLDFTFFLKKNRLIRFDGNFSLFKDNMILKEIRVNGKVKMYFEADTFVLLPDNIIFHGQKARKKWIVVTRLMRELLSNSLFEQVATQALNLTFNRYMVELPITD